jgi:hypothetical protein
MADFLLFFFYSWMTIYTPLYLHKNMGFSWNQIGVILFIMLLPFVYVQFPLGRLADKKYGEKEILSIGFVIMAIFTGIIFFITGGNHVLEKTFFVLNLGNLEIDITWYVILWAAILFVTRIGAASVEIMCDTYFFKKVDSLDTNIISCFRMVGPAAYILGPLFATLLFTFSSFDIQYLFLVLGLIMFIGLKFSLSIKDTR